MNKWMWAMYFSSVLGATAGIFFPILVAIFKAQSSVIYVIIARYQESRIKFGKNDEAVRTRNKVLEVIAFISIFLFIAISVASIASAAGFFAFLQSPESQKTFASLGALSYFSAFTYGYSTGSLVAEGMRVK
jgi:hypothetical protein